MAMTREMQKAIKDKNRRDLSVTAFLEGVNKGELANLSKEYIEFCVEIIYDNKEKVVQRLKTYPSLEVNLRRNKNPSEEDDDAPYSIALLLCVFHRCPKVLAALLQNGLDPSAEDLAHNALPASECFSPEVFNILIEWGALKKMSPDEQAKLVSFFLITLFNAERFQKRFTLMARHGLNISKMLPIILETVIKSTEELHASLCARFDRCVNDGPIVNGDDRTQLIKQGSITPAIINNRISKIRSFLKQPSSWEQVSRQELDSLIPLIASAGALFIMQALLEENLLDEDKIKQIIELAKQKLSLHHLLSKTVAYNEQEAQFISTKYTENRNKVFIKWLRRYLIITRIFSKGGSKNAKDPQYFGRFPIPLDIARKFAFHDFLNAPFIELSIVRELKPRQPQKTSL